MDYAKAGCWPCKPARCCLICRDVIQADIQTSLWVLVSGLGALSQRLLPAVPTQSIALSLSDGQLLLCSVQPADETAVSLSTSASAHVTRGDKTPGLGVRIARCSAKAEKKPIW